MGRCWRAAGCVYVLSAQHPQALSTSRFLLPCTVTVVTRRRAPAGQGREDLSVAWCSLCDVTWFGSCQVYLAVPWQQVPPAVLCCLQLPAVGVWSAACRPGHTRLLAACGRAAGGTVPRPRHELVGAGRRKRGSDGKWSVSAVLHLDPFHRALTLLLVVSRASAPKVHLLPKSICSHLKASFLQQTAAKQMKEQEVSWKTLKPHFAMFNLGLEQP